ncbi:MAG: CBS domain-containing protein [Methanobacteriota archaeon]|nr:MAG: CBS domain-containing protein [Euryarchaeota archaeon]
MIVRDIMHQATIVHPQMTVSEAAKLMRKKDIGSLLVKRDEGKWGVVTERDILNKIVAEDLNPTKVKVKEIMTDLKYTINADSPIEEASEIFNTHHIRRLPVVEKGNIVGIITSRDVAKRWIFTHFRRKVEYSRISGRHIR